MTIGNLNKTKNITRVKQGLKLVAMSPTQYTGKKDEQKQRKNQKEKPHEYKVIPFFSQHPHKDSSF